MFRLFPRRRPASTWRDIEAAPAETVLILATRPVTMRGGDGGRIVYAPQARIGWRDLAGVWTDFTTGFPLDIEPELFAPLPPLDDRPPPLLTLRKDRRGQWTAPGIAKVR